MLEAANYDVIIVGGAMTEQRWPLHSVAKQRENEVLSLKTSNSSSPTKWL